MRGFYIYGFLQEHLAPEVISHLGKYSASVTEIVKHLLTALKKKGDISNILLESLKRVRSLITHLLLLVFTLASSSAASLSSFFGFSVFNNVAIQLM